MPSACTEVNSKITACVACCLSIYRVVNSTCTERRKAKSRHHITSEEKFSVLFHNPAYLILKAFRILVKNCIMQSFGCVAVEQIHCTCKHPVLCVLETDKRIVDVVMAYLDSRACS